MQNALNPQQGDARAGGVVGIGQQDGARPRGDGIQHQLEREFQARRRVRDLGDLRARHLRIEAVHGVGRLEQEHFLAVVHVGVDEHLDGFVGAVGEGELLRLYVEVRGDGLFGRAIFGIDRQLRGVETFLQSGDHVRRAAHGVLIEIEAELVGAAGGGWRIRRHGEDGGPGLDGALGKFRRAS